MLLWVDRPDSDSRTRERIVAAHPKLEMKFLEKYQDAEKYLRTNAAEIRDQKKLLIISRGYYADEKKGFLDIADLLDELKFPSKAFVVYTKHRDDLLKRTSRASDYIIVERQGEVLAFIDGQLKN